MLTRLLVRALAVLAAVWAASASANDAALTVSRGASDPAPLALSLDDLAQMPQAEIVTENEFTNGAVTYRGPLVADVLAKAGLQTARTIRLTAANDYFVDIPTSDLRRYRAILAMEADGQRLSRRDKGPLWLMYPISENPELRDPVYSTRLIWQVVRIEPLPD